MNDCITTTKQSTTKPCAYFLGYTVYNFTATILSADELYHFCIRIGQCDIYGLLHVKAFVSIQPGAHFIINILSTSNLI